jgi:hypothetical protein
MLFKFCNYSITKDASTTGVPTFGEKEGIHSHMVDAYILEKCRILPKFHHKTTI